MYSASRATSSYGARSPAPCGKPGRSTAAPGSQRACSPSSSIARGPVGRGRGAWWPRPSRSKARKIRATSSLTGPGARAGPKAIRTALLRAGRDGEPHQGAVEFVLGSPEHRDPARQPASSLLLLAGLCVGPCPGANRSARNGVGRSAGRNDPAEAAENRRPGAGHRPPHLGLLQRRLPLEAPVHRGLVRTPLLKNPVRPEPTARAVSKRRGVPAHRRVPALHNSPATNNSRNTSPALPLPKFLAPDLPPIAPVHTS